MSGRLPPQRGEVIDRSRPIEFEWNGKKHSGFAGDTIASALAAEGISVFSRSFKYHRPRGILTASFHDPNLFVQVGSEPNVRAGHRWLRAGDSVESQNAWPGLGFDVKSANGLVGRFLSPGFYYKTFIKPRVLRPFYQRVLRRFSGGGTVPATPQYASRDKRFAHPDVLIAGGGPSGMAAAISAAEAGSSVMLIEEEHQLGGHLRLGGPDTVERLTELRKQVAASGNIEVLTNSVVTARHDHNWVAVVRRGAGAGDESLIKARAKTLVVAVGTIERPFVFEGNDLPGVMLSTAALRLINLYAVKPGGRAVVATANASGDLAAAELGRCGVDVVEIVDMRRPGQGITRAQGRKRLKGVELADGRRVKADLLVTAAGWTTPTSLLNMAGDLPRYEPVAARFIPGELPSDVMATGGVVGDGSLDELLQHGSATGAEAARRAAVVSAERRRLTPGAATSEAAAVEGLVPIPPLPPADHPEVFHAGTNGFVDYSEDVTAKDLEAAAEEGYDSIELAKRLTTVTMGPIQGKLEVVNAVAIHAHNVGSGIAETGTTTWRPPYAPITLGALAGRDEDAERISPMHDWHEAHGATPIVAGQWIRPEHYGDPGAEVASTRRSVGIIDVTPLGKIDLRGADVPKLLEFVYINRWSRLGIGAVRYGVMCAEDGVVMDDGVTARLAQQRYYMTTTSSGAGRVWNWLDEWLQTRFTASDVSVTAVTDGYAAMNVAGPKSRDLLDRLVSGIDLDRASFGCMQARTGTVAGVEDCILLRIGFTGELSFEVHVPSSYGLHVWESMFEAGASLGVAPFGLEAQRIMRLEKGHFIVGQDTDGLTKAGAAGVGWAVRGDKSDFVGRPELMWEAEQGPERRIVALQPVYKGIVPPEASQIVDGGVPRGRVTSSRMSPTLGRSVCLAQVDAELAMAGTIVTIRLPSGGDVPARILDHHAHFDQQGERLRG